MSHEHPAVLIIDDDLDLRDGLVNLFTAEGYAAIAVRNGQEGLDALQRGFHPCVIVLDLEMTVMDGYEFRRRQLADAEFQSVPVIVYSVTADVAEWLNTITADAFLTKPSDFPTLLTLVRRHCLK